MSSGTPLWQRGVEAVDGRLTPALEGATRHEAFGLGFAIVDRARRAVLGRTERASRRLLHSLNLPSASDVNRLLAQIAAVEHQVRTLTHEVEDRMPEPKEVLVVLPPAPRPAIPDRP